MRDIIVKPILHPPAQAGTLTYMRLVAVCSVLLGGCLQATMAGLGAAVAAAQAAKIAKDADAIGDDIRREMAKQSAEQEQRESAAVFAKADAPTEPDPPVGNPEKCAIRYADQPPGKPRAAQINHLGPAGILWGCGVDDTRAALGARWELSEEGDLKDDPGADHVQRYSGDIADFVSDRIEVNFIGGKLVALSAMMPADDIMAASRRWEMIVDKMTDAYGKPSKIRRAPDSGAAIRKIANLAHTERAKQRIEALADADTGRKYLELDIQIKLGEWDPMARWEFKNGVVVGAIVMRGEPEDKSGDRKLRPSLFFLSRDVVSIMRANKAKHRDL